VQESKFGLRVSSSRFWHVRRNDLSARLKVRALSLKGAAGNLCKKHNSFRPFQDLLGQILICRCISMILGHGAESGKLDSPAETYSGNRDEGGNDVNETSRSDLDDALSQDPLFGVGDLPRSAGGWTGGRAI
jgi:hypothetical protein